jgi:RimJ/RimL family protein N-acetyltransferase
VVFSELENMCFALKLKCEAISVQSFFCYYAFIKDSGSNTTVFGLFIRKVVSKSMVMACRRFLARDVVMNILPLGDLYSPLSQLSDVYCALDEDQVVGVCAFYHAFRTPSIVFSSLTEEIRHVLIEKALDGHSGQFVSLFSPGETFLFNGCAKILRLHREQQMIAKSSRTFDYGDVKVERAKKNELPFLDRFYVAHNAEAWTSVQFKTGPYYCVKQDGRIVSAAGVHLVTPQIAQLGNIVTDEAYRNRGFSTACTHALAAGLTSRGRIVSLFARVDNAAAIHVYEKLGFQRVRDIALLVAEKAGNA